MAREYRLKLLVSTALIGYWERLTVYQKDGFSEECCDAILATSLPPRPEYYSSVDSPAQPRTTLSIGAFPVAELICTCYAIIICTCVVAAIIIAMSRGRRNRSPAASRSAHLPVPAPTQTSNKTSQQTSVPPPADMSDVQTVRTAPLKHVTETGGATSTTSHSMQAPAAPKPDQMSKERTGGRGRQSSSPRETDGAISPSRVMTASLAPVLTTASVATAATPSPAHPSPTSGYSHSPISSSSSGQATWSSSEVTPSRTSDAASPEPGAFPRATDRASTYESMQVVWCCVSLIFSLIPGLLQDDLS
jgi:hypothetical protein